MIGARSPQQYAADHDKWPPCASESRTEAFEEGRRTHVGGGLQLGAMPGFQPVVPPHPGSKREQSRAKRGRDAVNIQDVSPATGTASRLSHDTRTSEV